MDTLGTEPCWERECTPKCRSLHHARQILSCTTKGTSSEVRSYCTWLCFNFSSVVDEFGRNLLHLAASCGKWEVVEWLLDRCHCDVDVRDGESGWTALHRSFFYGQLTVSRLLLSHGANLRMADHEGLTPLDLLIKDRPPHVEYLTGNPLEVYVWGSNSNFTLGLGNDQSREHPEIIDSFRRQGISIKQVVICKFHSTFLSNTGKVFTCGHGHGGRLGQQTENTSLVPTLVYGLESLLCEQVAAGQDHLVLLLEGGQVWTCGLNTYHQLGHSPPPERLLHPRPLLLKFLKEKEVIGVCAARFHSVFYTKDSVFTFGLNAGQLGHPKDVRSQILPRHVSALYHKDCKITHVVVSDGATVCATNRGDVFVLHEYQQRKIASLKMKIQKISVVGGHLDSHFDVTGVKEGGGLELRIVILTVAGKVFLWRQSNPFLRRCIFSSGRQLIVSDISLNHYTVAMVTHENEAFIGHILPPKKFKKSSADGTTQVVPSSKPGTICSQFNPLLEREDCDFIKIRRVMHIHRATSVTCDSKGRNFAALQSNPKMGLVDLPVVRESEIQRDMLRLWNESTLDDKFHDVNIRVGAKQYPAHKYILASQSSFFRKQFQSNAENSTGTAIISIENIKPKVLEQVLKFIYCNSCDLLTEGYEVLGEKSPTSNLDHYNLVFSECEKQQSKKSKKKSVTKNEKSGASGINYLRSVKEASKWLGVQTLFKKLDEVNIVDGKIRLTDSSCLPKLSFDRNEMKNLCDVKLVSNDGVEFPCHRCILVARLDYFHSMFNFNWMEASCLECLPVHIPSKVIDIILDFLYTGYAPKVFDSEDPEFLCNVLIVADQMFIERLKEICEVALVDLITLKNAPELLHIASACNAVQLKRSCLEYICINLPAIIEMKNLDLLSDVVMDELSSSYRKLVSSMHRRYITPSPFSPTKFELTDVEQLFPVNQSSDIIKNKPEPLVTKGHEGKSKGRRRTYSNRGERKEMTEAMKPGSSPATNDVVLDITLDLCCTKESELNFEESFHEPNPISSSVAFRPKQLSENCLPTSPMLGDFPELSRIMIDEKEQKTLLKFPGTPGETRKLSHLSQKQKKLLAAANKDKRNLPAHSLSQSFPLTENRHAKLTTSCPWARTVSQEPQTMSFWDMNANEKLLSLNSNSSPASHLAVNPWMKNGTEDPKDATFISSLKAIQQAEEEIQCAIIPKIKSLHIINIEDQAIEELLVMYKAVGNPDEKVTVSRILPEKIASPIWKKCA